MSVVLDTHAWVWWLQGYAGLTSRERSGLDNLSRDLRPCIADISLWEIAALYEKGRFVLPVPFQLWIEKAAHPATVRVLPLTPAIAMQLTLLPASFHRDPADRIIVSTARVHGLPLLTKDRKILGTRLVPTWKP
jgi:PIN domain nuclease of toxin-antitoxin system